VPGLGTVGLMVKCLRGSSLPCRCFNNIVVQHRCCMHGAECMMAYMHGGSHAQWLECTMAHMHYGSYARWCATWLLVVPASMSEMTSNKGSDCYAEPDYKEHSSMVATVNYSYMGRWVLHVRECLCLYEHTCSHAYACNKQLQYFATSHRWLGTHLAKYVPGGLTLSFTDKHTLLCFLGSLHTDKKRY